MTIPSNTPFPSLPARLSWAAPGELARRLPISELAQAPVSKRGLVRSYWYVNDFFIPMQIKLVSTTGVFQLAWFWKWEFLDLGNGLLKNLVWFLLLFDFQYIVNLNLLLFLKIISRTLYVSVTKLNDRYRFWETNRALLLDFSDNLNEFLTYPFDKSSQQQFRVSLYTR